MGEVDLSLYYLYIHSPSEKHMKEVKFSDFRKEIELFGHQDMTASQGPVMCYALPGASLHWSMLCVM